MFGSLYDKTKIDENLFILVVFLLITIYKYKTSLEVLEVELFISVLYNIYLKKVSKSLINFL